MERENERKLALSPLKYSSPLPLPNKEINSHQISDNLGCEDSQYGEEEPAIRSVAIIKKSQVEFPVSFRELQSNTDLKTPPSNWLRGQFSVCFPNITPKQSDFTSFIMGYQFPDCIGEVDIVSDAENIKKLLKMAYKPNTHLSMMVHRVGKTILIDEFDIYKYLLRQSQCEWKWLKKFFYEHVLESLSKKEQNVLVRPNKSRDVVQSKNLLSKFLYHSLGEEEEGAGSPPDPDQKSPISVRTISSPRKESCVELLPEDPLPDHLPDPSVQPFARNIIWNFEDLQMLIGTDLPIFGGRTHPCVSLRLRDMDKPISILTGIDYWLDNLMCNVPEVVMCYHQNGIVQKYELIKTEDLPHMSGSQFSPQLVRDIAHNILSFLKSKATKEGHTYWLFKGKDDDIVKLYDLTSLAGEGSFASFVGPGDEGGTEEGEDEDNPFTVPVAMLLYCVAKNMWSSKEAIPKAPTVRALLEGTLNLLPKEKYPKIVCHSHLILADLYLPQDVDPDTPGPLDGGRDPAAPDMGAGGTSPPKGDLQPPEGKRESKKKKKGKRGTEFNSINLAALCGPHNSKGGKHNKISAPAMLSNDVYDRCNSAIRHVIAALAFLEAFSLDPGVKASAPGGFGGGVRPQPQGRTPSSEVLDEPKMAKQFEPIPMKYEPLRKTPPEEGAGATSRSSPPPPAPPKGGRKKGPRPAAGGDGDRTKNVIVPKVLLAGAVLTSHLKEAPWVDKMRFQLLRKAALVYMTKGRIELNACNYGSCLRNVKLALGAWCAMVSILGPEAEFPLPSQPLLLAGDAYYNLSKLWDLAPSHAEDFNRLSKEQQKMTQMLNSIASDTDSSCFVKFPSDAVEAMRLSHQAFQTAVDSCSVSGPDQDLLRRLASICNELGCMFMNQADQLCQRLKGGIASGGTLWEESEKYMEKAVEIFRQVDDRDNLALLHCNRGRYLRLYAFHKVYASPEGDQVFCPAIKRIYEKAFAEYEQALDIMSCKQSVHAHVAESVVWEYSTTLFGFATIIQDIVKSNEKHDSELSSYMASLFHKCLKLCERPASSNKEPLYKYRAAVVHMSLAAMYHDKYRREKNPKMFRFSETHYHKSSSLFLQLDASSTDIFKSHLDCVVLIEDSLEGMKGHIPLFKAHLSILKQLSGCLNGLLLLQKQKKEEEAGTRGGRKKGKKEKKKEREKEEEAQEGELESSFLDLLQTKLQKTLLALLKLTRANHKSTSCYENTIREMYSLSLNQSKVPLEAHLMSALTVIAPMTAGIVAKFNPA